jgi:uncharacterized membrane protein
VTWLGILLLGAGAGLVYAAITGQHPITELQAALSTKGTQPAARPPTSSATPVQPIPNAAQPHLGSI